ncbi:uncharacterized protein BJX67DRAFT_31408 [Aspergillus lucknowensis]|uniref:Uncharacterized protein n=1 Tax=Aspergillus lucknowensis TaxID=176173 RepID=A0ABR4LWV1_9EURO
MQPQMWPNDACAVEPLAPDPRHRQSRLALFRYKWVIRSTRKGVTSAAASPVFRRCFTRGLMMACDCIMRIETGLTTMVDLDTGPACDVGGNCYRLISIPLLLTWRGPVSWMQWLGTGPVGILDAQHVVPVGPLEGPAVARKFHFLPFVLNSRPFALNHGYSCCPDYLHYHTASQRVRIWTSPLYRDTSRNMMQISHTTLASPAPVLT